MKKTITLSGKVLHLGFRSLCWEGVLSLSAKATSPTHAMANLIYSAVMDEDEVTEKSQGYERKDILALVNLGLTIESESDQLAECEALFQESIMYKRYLKNLEPETKDKKKEPRKK